MLVPVRAVLRDEDNLPFVYVRPAPPTPVHSPVARSRSARAIGDRYEVHRRADAGERVVTEGGLFVQFAQSQ